jgi:hypothetical protein
MRHPCVHHHEASCRRGTIASSPNKSLTVLFHPACFRAKHRRIERLPRDLERFGCDTPGAVPFSAPASIRMQESDAPRSRRRPAPITDASIRHGSTQGSSILRRAFDPWRPLPTGWPSLTKGVRTAPFWHGDQALRGRAARYPPIMRPLKTRWASGRRCFSPPMAPQDCRTRKPREGSLKAAPVCPRWAGCHPEF